MGINQMLHTCLTEASRLPRWTIGALATIPIQSASLFLSAIQTGNLVGFKGRAWRKNARPKYLVLGDKGKRQRYGFQTYDKSLVVFGLEAC